MNIKNTTNITNKVNQILYNSLQRVFKTHLSYKFVSALNKCKLGTSYKKIYLQHKKNLVFNYK